MWICKKCQTQNNNNDDFCRYCRTPKAGGGGSSGYNNNMLVYGIIAALAIVVIILLLPKKSNEPVQHESTPVPAVTIYVEVPAPTPTQAQQPTSAPAPATTPPTPATQEAPSVEDLKPFGDEITYPQRTSYLSSYETMYVKSQKGRSVYLYWASSAKPDFRRKYLLYEADEVTVLARENGLSCVIFTAQNGETHVGWVNSAHLVYEYS